MILYFTGEGNSRYIAHLLEKKLEESVVSINDLIKNDKSSYKFAIDKDEHVILVFPIYSWGVPAPITLFLNKVEFVSSTANRADSTSSDNLAHPSPSGCSIAPQIIAVATCGNTAGDADKQLSKMLLGRGLSLAGFFTVQMPNTYILLPGFDVDSDDVAKKKIEDAPNRVDLIVNAICQGRDDKRLYSRGSFPWFKTNVIYPPFIKGTAKTKFYATRSCDHCTLCEKLCPMNNIKMVDGVPQWDENCIGCLSCIHHCPKRAIEYGRVTQNKGRYFFREINNEGH